LEVQGVLTEDDIGVVSLADAPPDVPAIVRREAGVLSEEAVVPREVECPLPFIVESEEGLALASSWGVHLRA
jgi:hypothetical protein